MDTLETLLALLIAGVMFAVALFFLLRQRVVWRLQYNDPKATPEHRRFLYKQITRRCFGSLILIVLSAMLVVATSFDYQGLNQPLDNLAPEDQRSARHAVQFVLLYWVTFLLLLMALMALAVLDLWDTARHGVELRKQLLLEHQQILEAELAAHRHRRAELN